MAGANAFTGQWAIIENTNSSATEKNMLSLKVILLFSNKIIKIMPTRYGSEWGFD